MQHVTLTPFGQRSVTLADLAPMTPPPGSAAPVDKWALLARLRVARAAFGIGDRDLAVLSALLSFLPARTLLDGAPLVVHPSNAALSDRAHAMAESTLRRHLAALVAAGLVWRHDSPNGKRYAARGPGGQVVVAFGLDLTPLARAADRIADLAAQAEAQDMALHRRREALVLRLRDTSKLLAYAIEQGGPDLSGQFGADLAVIRRGLRRRTTEADLAGLEALLAPIHARSLKVFDDAAPEMTADAAHFERHHQNSDTDDSVLEPCQEDFAPVDHPATSTPSLPLALVVRVCPDILAYTARPPRHWGDFLRAAETVVPHMGISRSAWTEAIAVMGRVNAAVAVAGILQRFGSIHSAGGYLRTLTRRAAEGAFSPGPMIMALLAVQRRES